MPDKKLSEKYGEKIRGLAERIVQTRQELSARRVPDTVKWKELAEIYKDVFDRNRLYIDWEKFYKAFREIMLFELKKLDLLVYISVPIEENVRRTELRDNRKYTSEDIDLLLKLRNNVEEEVKIAQEQYNIPTLYLDGMKDPKENIKVIKKRIIKGV